MKLPIKISALSLLFVLVLTACGAQPQSGEPVRQFKLTTGLVNGKMAYIGDDGDIDDLPNPTLQVNLGDQVKISLRSGDGYMQNISVPEFNATSPTVSGNETAVLSFRADVAGTFTYASRLQGERTQGMQGILQVGPSQSTASSPISTANPAPGMVMPTPAATGIPASADSIARDPSDIPAPIGNRPPQKVRVDLEAEEVLGQLADGATYTYWTFNGKVPGPFFRVRVGDTVEVHMKNAANSMMIHSVDFHAVTGPGGGATMSQTAPGQETVFTFQALNPGLFVYHCATPIVAEHIANGMYGMILVEPAGGLPRVDHEFYVMQGEIYTQEPYGSQGQLSEDLDKILNETPEYYVFNGAVDALTKQFPLQAKVGDTVRIFFGDAGPNKTSSFHIIGEILDRVYDQGSLTSAPLTNLQTTLVPAGGAAVVELKLQIPGRYIFLDHAIARMQRGLMGYLLVDGPNDPEIYNGTPTAGSGH